MTSNTERYQVLLRIVAGPASKLPVVHLQPLHGAAYLATPTIALQYFPMQFAVIFRIGSDSQFLRPDFPAWNLTGYPLTRTSPAAASAENGNSARGNRAEVLDHLLRPFKSSRKALH
jgi:hypothetical protein